MFGARTLLSSSRAAPLLALTLSTIAVGCTAAGSASVDIDETPRDDDAGANVIPIVCVVETCNEVDDDCDGRVDEALAGGDLCTPVEASLSTLPTQPCGSLASLNLSFTEEAATRGVDFVAPPNAERLEHWHDFEVGGGMVVSDLDGDDSPDLLFTAPWGENALFLNDGTGQFTRVVGSSIEVAPTTTMASAADVDGDGLREVFLGAHDAVRSYANLGGGSFAEGAHLWDGEPAERPSFLAWTDFDGDSRLDAYLGVGSACFHVDGVPCYGHDVLFHGQPDGSLADRADALGLPTERHGLALAGLWEDLDHDGYLDALVGNDSGAWHTPNRVFRNPGSTFDEESFEEVSLDLGLESGMASMGTAFGDLDADGHLGLVISATSHLRSFVEFEPGTFTEERFAYTRFPYLFEFRPSAWAVELADLDHDMDLDLVATWHYLYHQDEWSSGDPDLAIGDAVAPMHPIVYERRAGTYFERPDALSSLPSSWMWHSVSPVDLNHDGVLDLVFGSIIGPTGIQMGKCIEGRHFLEVRLLQPDAPGNRHALGARVIVEGGGRRQWRRIGVGSTGAQSGREPLAHFGAADLTEVELSVEWPDGRVSNLGAVSTDQRLVIRRGPPAP